MNQQEFIDSIVASPLTEATKKKILDLIAEKGFDFDTREEIKDLIQEEIDGDSKDLLNAEDLKEVDAKMQEMESELQAIEDELNKDMGIVETEMDNLQKIVQDLDQVVDDDKIDQIKSQIDQTI